MSAGKYLSEIVHFGDEQVFEGATTYATLLFLDKSGKDQFRFVRVDDLPSWQATGEAAEDMVPATSVTGDDWNFIIGQGNDLFERLQQMETKLGDVADRIAQGIRTSANEVYVLDLVSANDSLITAYSKQLGRNVELERGIVSLFLQGREIKPYRVLPSGKVVILPYRMGRRYAELIPLREIEAEFPKTFTYLRENKAYLENRENGRFRGSGWHAYGRQQNIDLMLLSKLLVPDIADRASFALDQEGIYAFTSGYGLTLKETVAESPEYILGLLNSRVLDFYLKSVSTPLRGGFFRYFTQFIEQLPIRTINFSDQANKDHYEQIVEAVEQMLSIHEKRAEMESMWREWVESTIPNQHKLTQEFLARGWVEIGLERGWEGVKAEFQARNAIPSGKALQDLKRETEEALEELRPLYERIQRTDELIDQIVYRLYGLTEDEISVVEASVERG